MEYLMESRQGKEKKAGEQGNSQKW